MTRLYKKIAIFIFCFGPLLYLLQYFVDTGLRNSKAQLFAAWTDIYHSKINADVLITGSSRALVMTSPKIIDSVLGVNSYNLGLDGWTFNMQYPRLRIYLQHNKKPKFILQALDLGMFERKDELFQYEQFVPYLNDTIVQNCTRNYVGSYTFPEYYIPMFKYNNKISLISEGLKSYVGKGAVCKKYKGYYPKEEVWSDAEFKEVTKKNVNGWVPHILPENVQLFREMVKYCKANDIKLILEFPPMYKATWDIVSNADSIFTAIKGLATENNLVLLDYSKDTLVNNKDYFYNCMHLNKSGAEIFSAKLANDLKPYIKP